jgi:hypothetical protein
MQSWLNFYGRSRMSRSRPSFSRYAPWASHTYPAVAMLPVVPVSEAGDPALRHGDVGKRYTRIGGGGGEVLDYRPRRAGD